MEDPILVEVTRGERVESRHRGAFVVCDAQGNMRACAGDVEQGVFPRSAVKALQALPLVETGAAEAYGFGPAELALAQASHGGEPAHVALARTMLERCGLTEAALLCGPQWPSHEESMLHLAASGGVPSPLHNNCSGKHAGMLAVAVGCGFETAGYVEIDHPVQRLVRDALESVTGVAHAVERSGIDGCSLPTYSVPLRALARGFARFGSGVDLAPERAAAAQALFAAATEYPWHVAGTGRFCTLAMQALGGRALVKTGAEGVFCAALPEFGLGVALKVDDGATRASEAVMAEILARLAPECAASFEPWRPRELLNRRLIPTGHVNVIADAFVGLS
ncbi:L-asparaginase II [Rhodopseudomonas julia]|uniref:L-asparaginase II n=2 Tax=Rhodopseudomonas julia TaxID=200617 RepID=A0ABU0C293_9BRAD|nr:asparaginase [Rhodopseudomonas julia]MDQ0324633.1 L-asparaginase II [Rhodopseudomonas julia]